MTAIQTRKAARNHRCSDCGRVIKRGEIHLLGTVFKSDDGHNSTNSAPYQLRECGECAVKHGREQLIQTRRKKERATAQARYLKRKKAESVSRETKAQTQDNNTSTSSGMDTQSKVLVQVTHKHPRGIQASGDATTDAKHLWIDCECGDDNCDVQFCFDCELTRDKKIGGGSPIQTERANKPPSF